MTPSASLQLAIGTLLSADVATLAAVLALKVHLAKAAFVPSPQLDIGSLVECDYGGYAALSPTAGAQLVYFDPLSGQITVELKDPLGGWHFQTTGMLNLPQTVYGWWVTDNASAVLYGSERLPTPIPLSAIGQGFDLPPLTFKFSPNSPA